MREKLTRYQEEAAVVLWEAFKPQILTESSNQGTREHFVTRGKVAIFAAF
jgi:hypothetical protein